MDECSDVQFKQRAVIEFLTTEKVPPIEIHRQMQAIYGDQCVGVSTVSCWVRQCKDGEVGQADMCDKA
jgi:NAD(P)H-flavin reductase